MQEKKLREQLKAAWITLRDVLYDAADHEDIEETMGEMKAVLDATRDGTEMEKLVVWKSEPAKAKFISTPRLDCNFLEIDARLIGPFKIPIDAAGGTLLDGQLVEVIVLDKQGEGE